jgi:hypothetical protein
MLNPPLQLVAKPPEKAPAPLCFAQLKYRDVDAGLFGIDLVPFNHSFWWVQDSTGAQWIIGAGPNDVKNAEGEIVEMLHLWITAVAKAGVDNPGAKLAYTTALAESVCAAVDKMIAAAKAFTQDVIKYKPAWGPNCDSVANWPGQQAGIIIGPPPRAPGWDTSCGPCTVTGK